MNGYLKANSKKNSSLVALTEQLDIYLQEENADYESKRKNDILLKMPIIHIVPPGTFNQRIQSQKKPL